MNKLLSVFMVVLFFNNATGIICHHEVRTLGTLECTNLGRLPKILSEIRVSTDPSDNTIETLLLRDNTIIQIIPAAFSEVATVKHLDLSQNPITSYSNATFAFLTQLRSLNLSGNGIYSLQPDVMISIGDLQQLDLSNNALHITESYNNFFRNFKSLRILNISKNKLINFQNLVLGDDLRTLKASDIDVVKLESRSLNKMKYMKNLALSRTNTQEIIRPDMLHKLQDLITLDLSYNNKIFPDTLLAKNTKLTVLDISVNKNAFIWANMFVSNKELINLNIENNLVRFIEQTSFYNNNKLVILKLNQNRLNKLDEETFSTLINLEVLDLSNNLLSYIKNGTFALNKNLNTLKLNGNRLQAVSWVARTHSIEILGLADNRIDHKVNLLILSEVKNLLYLDISGNQLTELPKQIFELNLSYLSVACNNLSNLPDLANITLTINMKLALYGNPWKCACLHQILALSNGIIFEKKFLADGRSVSCVMGDNPEICDDIPHQKIVYNMWYDIYNERNNPCQVNFT